MCNYTQQLELEISCAQRAYSFSPLDLLDETRIPLIFFLSQEFKQPWLARKPVGYIRLNPKMLLCPRGLYNVDFRPCGQQDGVNICVSLGLI